MTPAPKASIDRSICVDCLTELLSQEDRRYRYPFIQCAACGPAFSTGWIDDGRADPSCPACRIEFETPGNRRHGFRWISCKDCGPVLRFVSEQGTETQEAALARAIEYLHEGRIVVIKASGGFHLAVDARNEEAVQKLRRRKRRPHKPFAVMARDLEWVERVAFVSSEDRAFLDRPERPILLLPGRSAEIAPSVAPGLSDVGLFLPSSGLQVLLLREGPPLQVMTSANFTREPTLREDAEALRMLGELADGVLLFDRAIVEHSDDSVFRSSSEGPIPIRRSRGFVPKTIELPFETPPLLAVGAQEKNTVCLAAGREAHLSQHIGDLESTEAFARFLDDIERLKARTGIEPVAVAHDLHPDYRSTRWALESGLPTIGVQHHHAHAGAVLLENGAQAAIAVLFDGTGLGEDGRLWGGEFFSASYESYRRLGNLRPLALAGGGAAIRNPWRLALAAAIDAGVPEEVLPKPPERAFAALAARLQRGDSFPTSTGAGRWFDAVAAMLGVRQQVSYDGQAAAELESVATTAPVDAYPFEIRAGSPFEIDLRATIRALAADVASRTPASIAAARFHETLARAIEAGCHLARAKTGLGDVVLGGGCFQNRLLLSRTRERLEASGFRVLCAREVPPNDGGIALGQVAVAAARLRSRATLATEA